MKQGVEETMQKKYQLEDKSFNRSRKTKDPLHIICDQVAYASHLYEKEKSSLERFIEKRRRKKRKLREKKLKMKMERREEKKLWSF